MLYRKILSGFVSLSFFVNPYYSYGGVGTKDPEQDPLEYSDYIITSNIQSSMLASTSSTELSLSSAQQQLIAAADNGDVLMQFEVALNFARGRRGFPYDIDKGINYLRLASSGKYIPAMFEYASLLENGSTGVEKNYNEAAKTYLNIVSTPVKKDKLQGFAYFVAMACYRLGLIYDSDEYEGLGLNLTTGNKSKEAKLYYKKGLKTLKHTDAPNKKLFKMDFLYLLGREKELSNKYFTSKARKYHPLIQAKLITNDQHIYNGLSNNPTSSRDSIDKLQKKILKSQEQLASNNYLISLKGAKGEVQSQFLQQLVRCSSRMNRTSKSFETQKEIIIGKASSVLQSQRDLIKIYDLALESKQGEQKEQDRRKLLQLYEDYVINQAVFNRIVQDFTRSYQEQEEEVANFEAINKYLDDLAKGEVKSANLKLLRYYERIDDFENSSKVVERVIQSFTEPAPTNEAKLPMSNDIDLTHIEGDDLRDLLESVSADNTVTGLILQRKNWSEINDLLNQALASNHNLMRLDLSGNQITAAQFQPISKNLKRLPNLRELILDNNLLKDEGVSLLLPLLRKNLSLQLLSLSNNEVSQLGCVMLFGVLAQVSMRDKNQFKFVLRSNEVHKFLNQGANRTLLHEGIVVEPEPKIVTKFEDALQETILCRTPIEEIDKSLKIISQKPKVDQAAYQSKHGYNGYRKISIIANVKNNGIRRGVIVERYDRRRKTVGSRWPESVHGIVFTKFPSTKPGTYKWGSGILIAPDVALTAAHHLYNARTKEEAQEIIFIPGLFSTYLPYTYLSFGQRKVIKHYFPADYKNSQDGDFGLDYAILGLDNALEGQATGYFGLESITEDDLRAKAINIIGYPADKNQGKEAGHYEMWGMEGKVKDIKDGIIYYEIDTSSGQNGAGIWYKDGEDYRVIGVHIGGDKTLNINYGLLLTPTRYNQITNWIKDYTLGQISKAFKIGESFATVTKLDLSDPVYCGCYIGAQLLASDNFPNLKKLVLRRNKLNAEEAATLARSTTITKLDLNYNHVGDDGAVALAENTYLTKLSLVSNQIGAVGAKALAASRNLVILNLSKNKAGGEGASALAKNTNLKKLSLSSNNLDSDSVQHLAENRTLTILDLSWCNVTLSAFAKNRTLTKLNLSGGYNGHCVGEEFLQNHTLTKLNLSFSSIDRIGALGKSSTLTKLDLSNNSLELKDLEFLEKNFVLTKLNLSCNNIFYYSYAPQYEAKVFKSLAENTTLTQLNLSGNNIGDEGAKDLAKNCRKAAGWVTLSKLSVSNCNISDEGAKFLAETFYQRELDLSLNNIRRIENLLNISKLNLNYCLYQGQGFALLNSYGTIDPTKNSTTLTQLSLIRKQAPPSFPYDKKSTPYDQKNSELFIADVRTFAQSSILKLKLH